MAVRRRDLDPADGSRLTPEIRQERFVVGRARRRIGAGERDAVDRGEPLPDEERYCEGREHEAPTGEQRTREEWPGDVLTEATDIPAECGRNDVRTDRNQREACGAPTRGGVLPQCGGEDRAEAEVPDERPEFVRFRAGRWKQHRDDGDRRERAGEQRERLFALLGLGAGPRKRDDREEGSGERARERGQHRAPDRDHNPAVLERVDRGQREHDAERVRRAAHDEIDHGAEREPEASEPRDGTEREVQDSFEDERGCDTADRAERERAERCADRGRDDAVVQHRVAAEPLAVPQDESVPAEEFGAEDLRGEVGAAPTQRDREEREHSGDHDDCGHRRPPVEDVARARARCDRERSAHYRPPTAPYTDKEDTGRPRNPDMEATNMGETAYS